MTNTTTDRLLSSALFQQSGKVQEAEQYYRKILANDPNHTDRLHNLGMIAYQLAERPGAIVNVAYVRLYRAPHAIV